MPTVTAMADETCLVEDKRLGLGSRLGLGLGFGLGLGLGLGLRVSPGGVCLVNDETPHEHLTK